MRRRYGPLPRLLELLLLLLLLLAHIADATPDAAALRIARRHQLQYLLRALLARPEPAGCMSFAESKTRLWLRASPAWRCARPCITHDTDNKLPTWVHAWDCCSGGSGT